LQRVEREIEALAHELARWWPGVGDHSQAGHPLAAGDRRKQLGDADREARFARGQILPFDRPVEPPMKIGRASQRHGQAQDRWPPPASADATAPGKNERRHGWDERARQQG
jgi:hypothetical protein